jgi:hypothetical protein
MKYQVSAFIIALSLLGFTTQAQTTPADSSKKAAQEKRAEQQAKADVYIVNKSQGKKLIDGEDSAVVKRVEKTHKHYKKKTRKTSCGVKPAKKSTT